MFNFLRNRSTADSANPACTLGISGVGDNERLVLASMLTLVEGRTAMRWQLGEATDADVLVVGSQADDALLRDWQASSKVWIAMLGPGDARPATAHTLQLPLRLFPLLTLLTELEQLPELFSRQVAPAGVSKVATGSMSARLGFQAAVVGSPAWQFAESLRRSALATAHGQWRRAGCVYLRDDGRVFATDDASLRALREGQLVLPRFDGTMAQTAASLSEYPIEQLAWFAGWWADADHLAPWLEPAAHYRLRQWPDFGTLRGDQGTLRIAALLASRAWALDALMEHGDLERQQVIRFLNAASLCGLLITSAPAPSPPNKPDGFLTGLLGAMRARLGLHGGKHVSLRQAGAHLA